MNMRYLRQAPLQHRVMASKDQSLDAQRLYDDRATVYDDSWHVRFTGHMAELLSVKPGQHILDLACGTGLMTYRESIAVGPSGSVIGVDISGGMLSVAEAKKPHHHLQNVDFYQHSITDLHSLGILKGRTFDLITCVSALVLIPDPARAIAHWLSFLKPGGQLVVDVTHPRSQLPGITCERVGKVLGRPIPSYRLNFQEQDDLRKLMENAGLVDVQVNLVSQENSHNGDSNLFGFLCDFERPLCKQVYNIHDAKAICRSNAANALFKEFPEQIRDEAERLFINEWATLALADGSIQEVDGVFVGIGTNAPTEV